jgi:hypothetical protein
MDVGLFPRCCCPISPTRRIKEIWPTFGYSGEGAKVAVHFRLASLTGDR